jgi:hypothetical protein
MALASTKPELQSKLARRRLSVVLDIRVTLPQHVSLYGRLATVWANPTSAAPLAITLCVKVIA